MAKKNYAEFLRDTGWGRPIQNIAPLGEDGEERIFVPIAYVSTDTKSLSH